MVARKKHRKCMVNCDTRTLSLQNEGKWVDVVSKSISWQHSFVLWVTFLQIFLNLTLCLHTQLLGSASRVSRRNKQRLCRGASLMLIVMQIMVQLQLRGEYLVFFSPLIVHYFVDFARLLQHHFGCLKIQNSYIKRHKRELGTKPPLCIYVGTDTSATAVAHILAMMMQTIFGVKQRCCPIIGFFR